MELSNFNPGNFYDPKWETNRLFTEQYSVMHNNEGAIKTKENELCMMRHSLLKAVEVIDEDKIELGLKTKIDKERNKHMLHRQDDRDTWINWLNDKKSTLEFMFNEMDNYYNDKEGYKKLIEAINLEINRVKVLTIEAMMNDREIFGRNPNDFEYYK